MRTCAVRRDASRLVAALVACAFGATAVACMPEPPADDGEPHANGPDGSAPLRPEGGVPLGVSVAPVDPDFAEGACGGQASAPQRVVLRNGGATPVNYQASIVGRGFTLSGIAAGVVPSQGEVPFEVGAEGVRRTRARGSEAGGPEDRDERRERGDAGVPLKIRARGGARAESAAARLRLVPGHRRQRLARRHVSKPRERAAGRGARRGVVPFDLAMEGASSSRRARASAADHLHAVGGEHLRGALRSSFAARRAARRPSAELKASGSLPGRRTRPPASSTSGGRRAAGRLPKRRR